MAAGFRGFRRAIQSSTIIRPFFGQDCTDSRPTADDIGRNKVNASELHTDAKRNRCPESCRYPGRPPDERLAHAYEEIKRADEQLTQMSERLAKIEGDTPRPAPAAPAPQSQPAPVAEPPPVQVSPEHVAPSQVSPAKPASRSPMALLMAAGFVVTALVLSAYGGGIVTRWAPQLGSARSSPPEGPTLAAQSAPSMVQVASAEAVQLPATPKATSQEATPQATPSQPTPPRATSLAQAQTTPPDAAPPAAAPPAVHRRQPQRRPIKPSCCRRSRAI